MTDAGGLRMLLVHAHPDDETINNGATMALYAAQGARVVLVTCTRGEQGKVIPPGLAHLAADRDGTLGEHRMGELAAAMAALGVREHHFLDEVGLDEVVIEAGGPEAGPGGVRLDDVGYRDSGMEWGPDGRAVPVAQPGPGAFALADVDGAARRLAVVVRRVRPQVVVTYEPGGGYGHPDHVQAQRVTTRAVELARSGGQGGAAWQVPKVYWSAMPASIARAEAAEAGPFPTAPADQPPPSMVVPDAEVTAAVDGSAHLAAKTSALRAHATQVVVRDGWYALEDGVGHRIAGTEYYRLAPGVPARPGRADADGPEPDLFDGI